MFGLSVRSGSPAAVKAALLLLGGIAIAVSCVGFRSNVSPASAPTSVLTLPGTPGHFDNGEFSFDYPTDWPVLAASQGLPNPVDFVVAVLGTGAWRENCQRGTDSQGDWLTCGADVITVPPGGVVVRIYLRSGGPAPVCQSPAPTANATLGPNELLKTIDGSVTTWEFRWPDGQFFWPNDPTFEVHTSDPAQLAKAEAMAASFRWGAQAPTSGGPCSPVPATHAFRYDALHE